MSKQAVIETGRGIITLELFEQGALVRRPMHEPGEGNVEENERKHRQRARDSHVDPGLAGPLRLVLLFYSRDGHVFPLCSTADS